MPSTLLSFTYFWIGSYVLIQSWPQMAILIHITSHVAGTTNAHNHVQLDWDVFLLTFCLS
jgi:hypothetical protein